MTAMLTLKTTGEFSCWCEEANFFFFNDTATTEIYTLSLHDALPISDPARLAAQGMTYTELADAIRQAVTVRSEEHTSELQSPCNLVCRLLLEKKTASCESSRSLPPEISMSVSFAWRVSAYDLIRPFD